MVLPRNSQHADASASANHCLKCHRITGQIVAAGCPAGPARIAIEQLHLKMIARKIDRSGQTGGTSPNDNTVTDIHIAANASRECQGPARPQWRPATVPRFGDADQSGDQTNGQVSHPLPSEAPSWAKSISLFSGCIAAPINIKAAPSPSAVRAAMDSRSSRV